MKMYYIFMVLYSLLIILILLWDIIITKILKYIKKAYEEKERFTEGEASIHQAISNYLQTLYKDTKWIISFNQCFWEKLKDVNKVIIFGWSAGLADISYLKMIRKSVDQNAEWFIYYYDDKAYKWLSEVLNKLGIDQNFKVHYIPSSKFWD
ncbi:MAG: hypothetical protein E7189_06000 [Erysipelotrichaceae bacterium]|nr:hypothetical protein [Erysipelotrichaceae bacterium]